MRVSVPKETLKKLLRWSQRGLLACAVAMLGYCAFVVVDSRLFQERESRILERLLENQHATGGDSRPARLLSPPKIPSASAMSGLIGRIEIPRLGLSVMIIEGDDGKTLRRAAGHVPGTALPGQLGNVGITAHRDTFFRPLRNIQMDDVITLTTLQGVYHYRVVSTKVVSPQDVEVLDSAGGEVLTLVTCYPFYFVGAAPNRFIVRAERVTDMLVFKEKKAVLWSAKEQGMPISHRERHRMEHIGWLRAAVLGATDVIVSTASLVLGVAAAHATRSSVMVAGVAGLVAGDLNQTVREIAIEHPTTVRVFESLGIDYCCGGKRTLNDACERAGVPVQRALDLLAASEEGASVDVANWAGASAGELIGHIVGRHHSYVRNESPRLVIMLEKVVSRHGQEHPELASIRDLFGALTQELSPHMLKEENILFPYFEQTESAVSRGAALPPAVFGSVDMPNSRMLADHDDAGELLAEMRVLSPGYRVPDSACPTYRALYHGLEEFERDLHHHVHLENNILFPRALHMEQRVSEAANEHH